VTVLDSSKSKTRVCGQNSFCLLPTVHIYLKSSPCVLYC